MQRDLDHLVGLNPNAVNLDESSLKLFSNKKEYKKYVEYLKKDRKKREKDYSEAFGTKVAITGGYVDSFKSPEKTTKSHTISSRFQLLFDSTEKPN